MSIQIIFNDSGLERTLSSEFKKRYPKAVASTLNKIAYQAMQDLRKGEATDLHLTNKFLQSSTQYDPARTAQGPNMQAIVGILDRVGFAERLVEGGERKPRTTQYIAVPVAIARNAKGKIPKGMKPSAILAKKGYFIKEISGVKGIWKHIPGGGIKLEYVLKPVTEYDQAPYLDFEEIVEQSVRVHDYKQMLMESILKGLGLI